MQKRPEILRTVACALGLGIVAVAALCVAVFLHLDTQLGRRLIVANVAPILENTFRGKIVIDRLGSIGPFRANGVDARVLDEHGSLVASLGDASIDFDTITLLRSSIGTIHIPKIHARHAEVVLLESRSGSLTLVESFEPKTPSTTPTTTPPPDVHLPRVTVDHVWAHGKLTGLELIDAEASNLEASFSYVSESVELEVHHASVVARSMPMHLDPDGTLSGKLSVPSNAPLSAHSTFDGRVNRLSVWADASWKDDSLIAAVDVPRAPADELRRVLGDLGAELDVREPGSLSLRAEGPLDELNANARIWLGRGKAEVFAQGSLVPDVDLQAVAKVDDLDARAMGAELPQTSVDARAQARIRVYEGEPIIRFAAEVEPFIWDGNAIPSTRASGTLLGDTLTLQARAAEPGAPVDAALTLRGKRLEFRIDAESRNLAAISRLRTGAKGALRVNASGTYLLDRKRIDAVASVSGSDLAIAGQSVRHLDAHARVSGPVAHPSGELKLEARRLTVEGRELASAIIEVSGSTNAFQSRVAIDGETAPDATLSFSGSLGKTLRFSDILLDLDRGATHAKLSADSIVIDGSNIEAKNVIVTGPGSLTASGRWQNGELAVVADAKGLDVTKLARLVDVELPIRGYVNLQADVLLTDRSARGVVSISARNLSWLDFQNGALDGKLVLENRQLNGNFHAQHQALDARLALANVELPGNRALTDIESWKRATGELKLTAQSRIAQLRRFIENETLARYKPSGRIDLDLKLEREDPEGLPDVNVTIATRRFQVADPAPKKTRRRAFLTSGTNLACAVALVGKTRNADASCAVTSQKKTLAEVRLRTTLPELAVLLQRLESIPFEARVVIVERPVEDWPSFVRPGSFAGRLGGTLTMKGTLLEPDANLSVWANNVDDERLGQNVDARVDVKYDGNHADFRLKAKHGKRAALSGHGAVRFSLAKLLHSQKQQPEVDAHVKIDRLELASIPYLKDNRIEGRLTGRLDADHLGTHDPKVAGNLEFDRLLIGNAKVERGNVRLDLDRRELVASAELVQRDGQARAELRAVPIWNGFAPSIDPERRMTAKLTAKKLSASILLPAVRGAISDIDGRIDADLALDLGHGKNQVRGYVRLSDGELQIPTVGQALDHVNVYVVAERGGVLRLREASLRGVSGKLTATGWATLDGFALANAFLGVRIREKEKLPLTLEGISMGDVWGGVDVSLKTHQRQLALDVNVRSLHLELPATRENAVQELEPDPHVRIGARRRQNGFVMLPVQPVDDEPGEPLDLIAKLHLGNEIWLKRGPDLTVRLGGELTYRAFPEARMTGQIQLTSGQIDVQGKLFEIQEGTITFQGKPTNPIVVATATWESPEGIVVYAEYRGPVDGGKLTLHAEPALSRDQIVSLLLFGSPDGSLGGGEGSGAGTATTVGGGVATKGLNRAMNDLTSLDVSTRIDTSEAGSPRPELVWQLTPRVSAQLGYNVEAPAPGKSPDRTLLTLEFRLFRRWALASTFGDRGSTLLDLLWRYRY